MNTVKHILFCIVIAALAVTPLRVTDGAQASDTSSTVACIADYGSLIDSLDQTFDAVSEGTMAQVFCDHFMVGQDGLLDTSSPEMTSSGTLYFSQSVILLLTLENPYLREFPLGGKPHSLHPEVSPQPPKA